ncbi:glycosyltransferase family 4 protein [Geomonas sp. RF6]|uniref:glycosyltransferase family 4 protein n=1 Tax=Geomonas sp. RF6 TaxID=2897342 RepID=UPI001E4D8A3C|nr:glycosyltransferase family 4 protein [Geomonas sp. RF6]UFS69934.1 glycosyltransferase family 4 protein [Geomonas sp. RF6]
MSAEKKRPCVVVIANTTWYLWNFRMSLMRMLQEQGLEVVAMAPADSYATRIEEAGIRFVSIPLNRRGKNFLAEGRTVVELCRLFRMLKPDVVLSYTPKPNIYASLACRACRIPIVNNVAGLGYAFIRKGVLQLVATFLYRAAFAWSRKVFFQNNDDLSIFVEKGIVKPHLAERLPGSGVDTTRFVPVPRQGAGAPFVFLLCARLLWDKGIGEYVEAARSVRSTSAEVVFRLLGPLDDGNPAAISAKQLQEWVDEGVVEYLGSTDSVAPYFAGADCVVLPSYREGVPRTLLEAASMGKPLITSDAPGCRDVVEHGTTGLVCAVRDAEDLARQMNTMLEIGAEQRREMGVLGRLKMTEEFSETIVLERYRAVVAGIVGLELGEAPSAESVEAKKGAKKGRIAAVLMPRREEDAAVPAKGVLKGL